MIARLNDEDLKALETILEVSEPGVSLRYSSTSTEAEDMEIWRRALSTIEAMRIIIPINSDKILVMEPQ